ncbi:MAG: peptide deformylase [Candidatus Acetothermia bacterium]|jgi:peptide deformylase|nr:peptide deformylase [Candidatus Acetothermia bacterium]MDH7506067.1 peptide deformylase [Candidatus Acetothermia bacterium]
MNRPILRYPDKRLRERAVEIEKIDGRVKELSDEMREALAFVGGLGLAAPQLGEPLRLILIDVDTDSQVLINPELVEADEENEVPYNEGCLSLPGIEAEIWRPPRVLVRGWTLDEKEIELERDGLVARVLLHELDHLDGVLFIDHLGLAKRRMLLKEFERSGRQSERTPSAAPSL